MRHFLSDQMLTVSNIIQFSILTIFVFSGFAAIFLQRQCYDPSSIPQAGTFLSFRQEYEQRGHLNSLLHEQALSHGALHRPVLQHALANLTGFPASILVVGVEWGIDVLRFGQAGHYVIGFEPMREFYDKLNSTVNKLRLGNNIKLHNVAVGASYTSQVHVNYQGHQTSESGVHRISLDSFTQRKEQKRNFSVMTVDIQGTENEVIRGSNRLLKESIKVLWFEVGSCNDNRVREILETLDDDFVLFDFVPIVKKKAKDELNLRERTNFLFNVERPAKFDEYLHWLCEQRKIYAMVQTDVLAVKRSFLPIVVRELTLLGENVCSQPNSNCLLRSLLNMDRGNSRNITLN